MGCQFGRAAQLESARRGAGFRLNIIADLIEGFDPESPNFRSTEIYNENWLLRGLLHQVSQVSLPSSTFSFSSGSSWFSEAMLPTAFRARYRGDSLAESRTNADGVVGHILVGARAKADLELNSDARQSVVIEAKIGAPLPTGTRNAPGFDQAARNVACMAEVLRRASLHPSRLDHRSFVVLAPEKSVLAGTFSDEMDRDGMGEKILDRVSAYDGELDAWYEEWAKPTLRRVALRSVSWESAIQQLAAVDPKGAESLSEFYQLCLKLC